MLKYGSTSFISFFLLDVILIRDLETGLWALGVTQEYSACQVSVRTCV